MSNSSRSFSFFFKKDKVVNGLKLKSWWVNQKLVSLQQNSHKLCPKSHAVVSADHKHLTGETFINVMTRGGNGCFHRLFRCRCCIKADGGRERARGAGGEGEGGKGEWVSACDGGCGCDSERGWESFAEVSNEDASS